ncbi:unnamed protein product [Owenia fusiformis]|uniref:Uncharacterized protein n=1 Tax=Owenia fusiformis TaxID=6347 RepID=A0A8J1Y473_OWEFU|nr:unnamed protein product [Owenia fusiformis]
MTHWATVFAIFGLCFSNSKCLYVDMTYDWFAGLPQYPGHNPFKLKLVHKGPFLGSPFYILNDIEMPEHTGTHIDAPYHFNESGWRVNEIPLDHLVGPAVVLDIREKMSKVPSGKEPNADVVDAETWESKYGRIPNGAIVIMNSGNGKNWPNVTAYSGAKDPNNSSILRFPGFSLELAEWLVKNRTIIGIATDALSFEPHPVITGIPVHNLFASHNVWGVENLANIDQIPENGANVYVMPLRIRGGSGSPARVFAKWNKRKLEKSRKD